MSSSASADPSSRLHYGSTSLKADNMMASSPGRSRTASRASVPSLLRRRLEAEVFCVGQIWARSGRDGPAHDLATVVDDTPACASLALL
ncbi:hypothetical protein ZEAMMB73_Zm00001d015097 [Zea mays]|uniref:Uncharacterized protein n=1 Tax=Zea mays TaxID=4577 RepID=B8A040_MAIZE|nr:unknown [Zea mays]AQK68081.1 hypothetical protein ZEAMMB73_Zm00001d015097 [Zea mays]AQK68083.1 hypothetical protein ZEAMMB73_Zm00001d015097 [Zea mays]AQK68085.1 hypothetical protein ZEAMMB73_Zm00001d015097 [Zea mays]AQK68086.1 hypothetical protein ZEAMMB73_Zm00001d015097 [Zea mays]